MSYKLPIGDTLKDAWHNVHGAKGVFWGGFITIFIVLLIMNFMIGLIMSASPVLGAIAAIALQIVVFLMQMGLFYQGIKRAQNQPIEFRQLFRGFQGGMALRLICVYLLEMLLMIIPVLLMIAGSFFYAMQFTTAGAVLSAVVSAFGVISMIVLFVRLLFAIPFVLDKELDPVEAISRSFMITKHNFWRIFFLFFIQFLIITISAIPFGIGLIWTIPFSFILLGTQYKNLSSNNLS